MPIRVIVHRAEKTSVFVGGGNELSEGGLALSAGVELKTGGAAEIEFTPPYSGGPIRIRGVVRNRSGYRYGMEFMAEGEREEEQVDRLKTLLTVLSSSSAHSETVER